MDTDQTKTISPDLTIAGFCAKHNFHTTKYFKLRAAGRGPRELRIDRVIRITPEADADWVREHENPTGAEARLARREREELHRQGVERGKASAASPKHISKRRKGVTQRQSATTGAAS